MRQRLGEMFKSPFNMLPIVSLVVVFIAGFSVYSTVMSVEKDNRAIAMVEEQQKEREWRNIESVLKYTKNLYRQNSRVLAIRLENELRTYYPDLTLLLEQMKNNKFDDEFYGILKSVLYEENSSNQVIIQPYLKMVGTKDHIIAFYSNYLDHGAASLGYSGGDNRTVPWSRTLSLYDNVNPVLYEQAMNAIMDRSNKLIFTQKSDSESVGKLNTMSITELRNMFYKGGIEEFKNINILAPAYITETGDIFGIEDYDGFLKNDNHKIVIVQTINAYQILEKHNDLINEADASLQQSFTYVKNLNSEKIVAATLKSLVLFMMAIFLLVVYNTETRRVLNEGESEAEKHDNRPRGE